MFQPLGKRRKAREALGGGREGNVEVERRVEEGTGEKGGVGKMKGGGVGSKVASGSDKT